MHVIQSQVECSSAKEFLDALSPLGRYFKQAKLTEPWLFRGQGKDWPLVPSFFRKDRKVTKLTNRDLEKFSEERLAERDILIQFFNIADKRGLILPDDSQELRATLETFLSERGEPFVREGYDDWLITEQALSLTALAQHYGIPTRLLDWTRNPFIAAFFAAEDAINLEDQGIRPIA
jgi:hypothetical protein